MGDQQRPGGWVEGIGWVALLHDLDREDRVRGPQQSERPARIERQHYPWSVAVVLRWADGTVPVPPVDAGTRQPPSDELVERLREATGIEDLNHDEVEVRGLLSVAADRLEALPRPAPSVPPADERRVADRLAEMHARLAIEGPEDDALRCEPLLLARYREGWRATADAISGEPPERTADIINELLDRAAGSAAPVERPEVEFPDHDPGWGIHEPDKPSEAWLLGHDPAAALRRLASDGVAASSTYYWHDRTERVPTVLAAIANEIDALRAAAPVEQERRDEDVRLYGTPEAELLDSDPDEAVQSYLDGFCGEFPVTLTIDEHDTYPPRSHLPAADYAAEWCAEWAADNDTDEGWGDQAMEAAKHPDVLAAFGAAIDALASRITYRMADKVTASYQVTITDESTWTYDPPFRLAAVPGSPDTEGRA